MKDFAAVLHSLADDDGPQLMGLGVGGGGADAGAGRAAGDEQGIDAPPQKVADERGAGKSAGVFFADDVLAVQRFDAFINLTRPLIPLTEFR